MQATPEPVDELRGELDNLKRPGASKSAWITTAVGAAAGLAAYHFIGCRSGACLLLSSWWTSTLYGILMAHLVRVTFKKD